MAKALNDYAPIQSGIMTTVHAYTGDQMILDGPHRKGDLTKEVINAHMKSYENESYGYTEEELVPGDIVGETHGSIFDATQTMVSKVDDNHYLVQVVAWYDNENSYKPQMVRTIKYMAEL